LSIRTRTAHLVAAIADLPGPRRVPGLGSPHQAKHDVHRVMRPWLVPLAVGVAIFCGAAAADARPTLTAPARVRMGARVSVTVHGFAPNRRLQITIQAARYYLSNGGAIAVKTSVRVGANGSAVVRFRWPRGYYAVCVGARCPPVTPWRAGEHAYITVDDSVGPDPGEDVATSPRPVLVTSARGRAAILVSDATVPEAARAQARQRGGGDGRKAGS
jgi:hypothetical protein